MPRAETSQIDVAKRINEMHDEELQRLMDVLNFALAGATIGEAEAFDLLAEIEVLAIKEADKRNPDRRNWIPDEQLAGYIA